MLFFLFFLLYPRCFLRNLKYKNYDCVLRSSRYNYGGGIALQLFDANDGELISVCTVNLPEEELGENEVFIKDYSENEGMVNFLVNEGIIELTGETVQSGFVSVPKARLLIEV